MTLSKPVPILRSFDETKAREFYVNYLGFNVDWDHRFGEKFPLYMQVSSDNCTIHLSEHHGDCNPGAALRIGTTDLQELHTMLAEKEYRFAKPEIEQTAWNTREMSVTDPFGNRLIFFEAIT